MYIIMYGKSRFHKRKLDEAFAQLEQERVEKKMKCMGATQDNERRGRLSALPDAIIVLFASYMSAMDRLNLSKTARVFDAWHANILTLDDTLSMTRVLTDLLVESVRYAIMMQFSDAIVSEDERPYPMRKRILRDDGVWVYHETTTYPTVSIHVHSHGQLRWTFRYMITETKWDRLAIEEVYSVTPVSDATKKLTWRGDAYVVSKKQLVCLKAYPDDLEKFHASMLMFGYD